MGIKRHKSDELNVCALKKVNVVATPHLKVPIKKKPFSASFPENQDSKVSKTTQKALKSASRTLELHGQSPVSDKSRHFEISFNNTKGVIQK